MTFLIELWPDEEVGQYLLAAMTSIDAITLSRKTNSGKTEEKQLVENCLFIVCVSLGKIGRQTDIMRLRMEFGSSDKMFFQLTSNKSSIRSDSCNKVILNVTLDDGLKIRCLDAAIVDAAIDVAAIDAIAADAALLLQKGCYCCRIC